MTYKIEKWFNGGWLTVASGMPYFTAVDCVTVFSRRVPGRYRMINEKNNDIEWETTE